LARYEKARKDRGNGVQIASRAVAEAQMRFADLEEVVFPKSAAYEYDPTTVPV
jgi:hypothetical protein